MKITKELLNEFETVRATGATNMMYINGVLEIAELYECSALIKFINEHGKKGYIELLKSI